MASSPAVVTFRFIEDAEGRIKRLQLQESGRPLRTASRVDFERVDVTFHNGATKLAGTVVSRQPVNKRPGIVLIPGGGPQKRDNLQSLWWAYNEFRVLTYDKRGVGQSSGAYPEASILDLATDAASAVSALRSDALTDKTQVGVVGHSEGGFVAPVLASRVPDLAFVIVLAARNHAGPGSTRGRLWPELRGLFDRSDRKSEGAAGRAERRRPSESQLGIVAA